MLKNLSSKVKTKLIGTSIDLAQFFKSINFKAAPERAKIIIKSALSQIDDEAKTELSSWLLTVRKIKENPELNKKEKHKQLSKLKTSDAVLSFFNSLIDLFILKMPIGNKKILKAGVTGAGFIVSFMSFRKTGIILLVLFKALPQFIMTRQFDEFSKFVSEQIEIQ